MRIISLTTLDTPTDEFMSECLVLPSHREDGTFISKEKILNCYHIDVENLESEIQELIEYAKATPSILFLPAYLGPDTWKLFKNQELPPNLALPLNYCIKLGLNWVTHIHGHPVWAFDTRKRALEDSLKIFDRSSFTINKYEYPI